jgi:ABC-type multidrug transport system fused ATPase/permease subunit
MITNDEKHDFDNPSFDIQRNKSPNWEEIESLLRFAEELKTKNDASYDSIFLFSWFQAIVVFVSFFVFIFLLWQINYLALGVYSLPDFILSSIILLLLLICLFASEKYLRKIRRRIKSDSRALASIVDLLRENSLLITSGLSDLQKIQLKICTSRFDIGSSIPMPWIISLIRLLPGSFRI